MSGALAPLRRLLLALEASGAWRSIVRRFVPSPLETVPALRACRERWLDVYSDLARHKECERLVGETWLLLGPRRALAGLILTPRDGSYLLHTMRVRRPFRGVGLGGLLLCAVLDAADEQRIGIWLQVREDNTAARRLYERHGFRQVNAPAPERRRPDHVVLERPIAHR